MIINISCTQEEEEGGGWIRCYHAFQHQKAWEKQSSSTQLTQTHSPANSICAHLTCLSVSIHWIAHSSSASTLPQPLSKAHTTTCIKLVKSTLNTSSKKTSCCGKTHDRPCSGQWHTINKYKRTFYTRHGAVLTVIPFVHCPDIQLGQSITSWLAKLIVDVSIAFAFRYRSAVHPHWPWRWSSASAALPHREHATASVFTPKECPSYAGVTKQVRTLSCICCQLQIMR